MADRRELVFAAAKTALEVASVTKNTEATTKPAGLNVYRSRARQADVDLLPDASLVALGETRTPWSQSATDVTERNVSLGVLVRVKADSDESGDAALFPVIQWAELALLADYTLGGLAANGDYEGWDRIETEEHADVIAEALVRFTFAVHTKRDDPRQAP